MKRLIPLFFVVLVSVFAIGGCARSTPSPTARPTEPPPPTSTPAPEAGDVRTRPADEMVMVYVPEGEFEMGSTDAQVDEAVAICKQVSYGCKREVFEGEQPVHTVELDGFWIDRTEVTNAQFRRCVEAGECEVSVPWNVQFEDPAKTNHPKVHVKWPEAKAYCEWAGGRLPTEAEWEYAARGLEGRVYPWGNELDGTRLNWCDVNCPESDADDGVDDGYELTAPVGSYPDGASWCGALDMLGNVDEWTADWFADDYYATSPSRNPTGPTAGEERVVRGGSWDYPLDGLRGALRNQISPDATWSDGGFRCAKDAD